MAELREDDSKASEYDLFSGGTCAVGLSVLLL